jgi:Na+/H+-dicarboxylate symporter
MIILPLLISAVISGVANIGAGENLGRIGLKTIGYYLLSTIFAVGTGSILVNLIKPGVGVMVQTGVEPVQNPEGIGYVSESFGQMLINIIPTNIFESIVDGQMLSIVFFCILFGFFVSKSNENTRIFIVNIFKSVFEVMMKVTMFIIKFTPLGIIGIIAPIIADNITNLSDLLGSLAMYSVTVLAGLFWHGCVTASLGVKLLGRASPWKLFKAMRLALLTAFTTSSSGATLSMTLKCVEHNAGVSSKVTNFLIPLGATVNMDGTALYECVAAIFIAQVYGINLTMGDQAVIVFTSLLVAFGTPAVPMAGMVMMSVVLSAVDLPLEGVGLILAVDRFLDMFRTTINVWSDMCAAVVIAKSEGEKLNV